MGPVRAILIALLMLTPTLLAQPSPPDPSIIGGPVNEAYATAAPPVENSTGEDITSEEIDLGLFLDVRNAEFELLGVLFGGGKVQTDLRAEVLFVFRAVSVDRLEPAMRAATGDANVSLAQLGINGSRTVLTAEEIRTAGGGVLLEAFQGYQEGATETLLEEAVPGVNVLSARFTWENTLPAERPREDREEPSLREPPIVLHADITVRYLDRYALVDILRASAEKNETEDRAEDTLQERIEENQTAPLMERDAFQLMGVSQLLAVDIPPGWRVNVTLEVPKGFTIAGATDALTVQDDRERANYYLDGSDRETPMETSGVVTLSDRFLVTAALITMALLLGALLRIPAELLAFAIHRRWGS
ncbi:MAG: hypothetical protein R3185_06750 [Candidatus Thermoplasmatota archaeon]|nr:hypothetical protein [Candidatus Thermoplasmatota archaeon]